MTLEELIAAIKDGTVDKDLDLASILQKSLDTNTAAIGGMKTKNANLMTTNKALKKSVDSLPGDFDQELWETMVAEHSSKEDDKLKAEGKWNELKEQLMTQHTDDLGKKDEFIASLRNALSTQLIDNAAVKAITEAEGNAALLLPHVKANLLMTEGEGGIFSAIVADSAGEAKFSKLKAGEAMGIEELVNEFKANETYAAAFTAPNSGGGAGGSGSKGFNGKNPFLKGDDFNYTEQAKMNKANPELAAQMKSAAA